MSGLPGPGSVVAAILPSVEMDFLSRECINSVGTEDADCGVPGPLTLDLGKYTVELPEQPRSLLE